MAIFAAGPLLGDFQDMGGWIPPSGGADVDFKRQAGPGVIGGTVRSHPQRVGSRLYDETVMPVLIHVEWDPSQ